jgi:hypothetical protein
MYLSYYYIVTVIFLILILKEITVKSVLFTVYTGRFFNDHRVNRLFSTEREVNKMGITKWYAY